MKSAFIKLTTHLTAIFCFIACIVFVLRSYGIITDDIVQAVTTFQPILYLKNSLPLLELHPRRTISVVVFLAAIIFNLDKLSNKKDGR